MFGIKAMKAALVAQQVAIADQAKWIEALQKKLEESVDSLGDRIDIVSDNAKDEIIELERSLEKQIEDLDNTTVDDVIYELDRAGVPTDSNEFQSAVDESVKECDTIFTIKEQTNALQQNFNQLFSYH